MKLVRVMLAVLGAAVVLLVTACGGGQNVPSNAVAVVNGTEISRSELDGWLEQAKTSYQSQKQQFPKVGTPEYQQLQAYWVNYLVRQTEWEQWAEERGITVTQKEID